MAVTFLLGSMAMNAIGTHAYGATGLRRSALQRSMDRHVTGFWWKCRRLYLASLMSAKKETDTDEKLFQAIVSNRSLGKLIPQRRFIRTYRLSRCWPMKIFRLSKRILTLCSVVVFSTAKIFCVNSFVQHGLGIIRDCTTGKLLIIRDGSQSMCLNPSKLFLRNQQFPQSDQINFVCHLDVSKLL